MKRLKIFSSPDRIIFPRRKIFSGDAPTNEGGMVLRELVCRDCGTVITSSQHPSHAICPNCGGTRLDIKFLSPRQDTERDPHKEENIKPEEYRKPIFGDAEYQKSLREFSGKTIPKSTFEKRFSETQAEGLIEKGFATVEGDYVIIDPISYEAEKTFSKLIISVTKTLELDPDIVSGKIDRGSVIDHLEEDHRLPEKGIMIIKKAHGLPLESHMFCEDSWVEDSGIIPDLELEYNNQSFGVDQFLSILHDRYPDAPENILDILIKEGVVRLDGTQVTIQSNSIKN